MQATVTPSIYSHPEPASDLPTDSSGTTDHATGTFSGKKISSHQSLEDTATSLMEDQGIEDAFWEKKPLDGRHITSADVLGAYGKDKTSLRSGLFLEKLCLQNILHNNRKVNPYDVIQEFNRLPDQDNLCKSAIRDFREKLAISNLECNVRRELMSAGMQVTPDEMKQDLLAANDHRCK
ncbi:hypothetical protein [Endozoicomonas acroporae]|uniref:hypothetical protein n=1 Tax=Endozoicomonas acroporae TaxID=1701104 RepID=UPI0013D2D553|nr:hypothetical protein [Endozoicomonas acroporae]